jgi:hypothetical protein
MSLTSALEDLQGTTLEAVSGALGKLGYLSALRSPTGGYSHWGLARVHGDAAAEKALKEAHRSLLSQILATPVRKLREDMEQSSKRMGLSPAKFLEELQNRAPQLVPPEPGAGSARHLSSVLHALSSLTKTRRGAIRPIS